MSVLLTEKAANEVKRLMESQDPKGRTFLRIGIMAGGCSGFSYSLGFDNQFDERVDSQSEQLGISLVMNKKYALYLDGTTLDFYEDSNRRGFTFDNPNMIRTCSCGH
ncbi:MAG: iron-sulfur cluster assembly accessory protein [Pirellulales bacterium]|nr:iron-sulfur cluster assembly accessory protein [Pirellulales bacterium]